MMPIAENITRLRGPEPGDPRRDDNYAPAVVAVADLAALALINSSPDGRVQMRRTT
jgi:hypothetical protein